MSAPVCSLYANSSNLSSSSSYSVSSHLCYKAPQETWSWWVVQVGTPVLALIGLPGNVLTLLLMRSRPLRHKSYCRFLSLLAVSDSLLLLNKCHKRLVAWMAVDVVAWSRLACKAHGFVEHVCYLMSSWLTLCLSAERLLMLRRPLLKHALCGGKKWRVVALLLCLLLAYSQTFRLVHLDVVGGRCTVKKEHHALYLLLHVYLYQILLHFLLPNFLTILCNFCILSTLRSNSRRLLLLLPRSSDGTTSSSVACRRHHDVRTTCMLLVVTFLHEATILPILTLTLVLHFSLHFHISLSRAIFSSCVNVKNCLELLSEVTFSVNFYIYVLWGRPLRTQVRRLLCCSQQ